MFKLYSIVVKKNLWTATEHLNPSLKWWHLAQYNTEYRQAVPEDRKKGSGVRWVSTQKGHIIVTVKTMGFMHASMTTVVDIVVSISTNWLAKCSSNINYQKRVRGFEGFQTPKNRWKHEATGPVLLNLLFWGVWNPWWNLKHEFLRWLLKRSNKKIMLWYIFFVLSSPNERTIIHAAMQSCHIRNITSDHVWTWRGKI